MYYQLPNTYRAEEAIASRLALLRATPSPLPPILVEKAIEWAQSKAGFGFDPQQVVAIKSAIENKLSIITGGPGTGKTTILRAIVDILKAKKVSVLLTAPTGRASQRMAEATRSYAQTIHRLLKFDPHLGKFLMNEESPIPADFVVVDESSMLDTKLAAALFKAIAPAAHVLLVGDIHQLPSVGPGNILKNFIESHQFQVTFLSTVFRQANVSKIVSVAHNILEGVSAAPGILDDFNNFNKRQDLHFIKAQDPQECLKAILDLYLKRIPSWYPQYDSPLNVQVLAPMHKGIVGIANLNLELQKVMNPSKIGMQIGFNRFLLGDKVIQLRNNYDKNIFNGDIGVVEGIDSEKGTMIVDFDGNRVEFERMEMGDLSLAYAMSIHKSQGSEFPIVIIPLLKQHFMMLQRNLVYTAITRGRKKVFLVGDPVAYAMAIRNQESTTRSTHLCQKISRIFEFIGSKSG